MATYKELQSNPSSRTLFGNRISTLQGLQDALKDSSSALISLDTEHFAVTSERDRILHQVGLAHIDTGMLSRPDEPPSPEPPLRPSWPSLLDFYAKNQVQALTLNIELSTQDQHRVISRRGKAPLRRPHRFGQEQRLDIHDVEDSIISFIDKISATHTTLILVWFEMAAEWTYLSQIFPKAMPYFSLWVDVRDIAKDIASAGVIPGLVSLLQVCGYHWKDIKSRNRGKSNPGAADNAADDAVSILAAACALLDPRVQEKLRVRQNCSQIARIHTTKKGSQGSVQRRLLAFTATIQSSDASTLPLPIDSGMKLARRFLNSSPKSTGILTAQTVYISFENTCQLEHFIERVDETKLPEGVMLSVQPLRNHAQKSAMVEAERLGKQELRKEKKEKEMLETCEDSLGGLDGLFSFPA
ncbi:hypothetical protein B0I35DRAFT_21224 [Stachybotrys elegans]|uniref:Uncharacterized protein n=1 Tax=Stachybotrys elegans TaxID=80388 RepID=A0A8K0T299_9HYPO|nr:hypothetical protein B0I35DRAFT_21224 [Stachybotrys elegans]